MKYFRITLIDGTFFEMNCSEIPAQTNKDLELELISYRFLTDMNNTNKKYNAKYMMSYELIEVK